MHPCAKEFALWCTGYLLKYMYVPLSCSTMIALITRGHAHPGKGLTLILHPPE